MEKRIRKRVIITAACLVLVGMAGFWLFYNSKPAPLPVEEIFSEGVHTPGFMQISLFAIKGMRDNKLYGSGHVRYNNNGQIYGYGEGRLGMPLRITFSDIHSREFDACIDFLTQPIPFKNTVFISGIGMYGTNGLPNPVTGLIGGKDMITFKSVDHCGYLPIH